GRDAPYHIPWNTEDLSGFRFPGNRPGYRIGPVPVYPAAVTDRPSPPLPEPDLPDFAAGSVWLVGAGPGEPGLLSLLALHALRRADTVVHDALVDERVLRLARPGARLEFAGKRGGKPSPKQPDISARLVHLARA